MSALAFLPHLMPQTLLFLVSVSTAAAIAARRQQWQEEECTRKKSE